MNSKKGPRTNRAEVRRQYAEELGHEVMDNLSLSECAACHRPLRDFKTVFVEMISPVDDDGEWERHAAYCPDCVSVGGGRTGSPGL